MLSLMRKHAGSWMIKIMLGVIVLVFVFWGMSFNQGDRGEVATVDGEVITQSQYERSLRNMRQEIRNRYGDNFDNDLLESMDLESQTMETLVDSVLIKQRAQTMGLAVTDEELAAAIAAVPAFQAQGGFSMGRYRQVLQSNGMTRENFERDQKSVMQTNKLTRFVTSGVTVTPAEARSYFDWTGKKVDVRYVVFRPDRFDDPAVTEEELAAYFNTHAQDYRTPTRVKAEYVFCSPARFHGSVRVPQEEIEEYYNDFPEEFEREETVEARHILIKVEEGATQEEDQAALEKAREVEKLARSGEKSFADLAREHSQGPSAPNGGNLGAFSRQQMVKPFADKAFSMEEGEISEPVRTRFGWHLILVEKVNPGGETPLDEAAPIIRRKLAEKLADDEALDTMEKVFDGMLAEETLEQAAKAQGLDVVSTDFFTEDEPLKGVAAGAEFSQRVHQVRKGDFSDIMEFPEGYYMAVVQEKEFPKTPSLEEVKSEVRADLIAEKKREIAEKEAQGFLDKLRQGSAMVELAASEGLKSYTTGFFSRNQNIPQVGFSPAFSEQAFMLSAKTPLPKKPVDGKEGYYVLRYVASELPDDAAFEKDKEMITLTLLQEKQQKFFESWVKGLRENALVEYKGDFAPKQEEEEQDPSQG